MKKFLTAFSLVAFAASPAFAKEVAIGLAGPFSGPQATFGEQFKRGAEMAVADVNAAGGILGQEITLNAADDSCDPKQAVTVANKLAAQNLPVVIGHFCSGSSIPASSVYEEAGTLMISPGSSNPALTEAGRWNVFRVVARDDKQARTAAKYIKDHFADKKIAIIHDKQTYSKGLADGVKQELRDAGVKETLFDTINPGERDYSALVTKLKQNNIDVVFYGGYHTEAGLIVRQMREQNMKTVLMGGDALTTKEFWSITGEAGEGTLMTFPPDPRMNAENADLVKRFKAAKFDPEGYTLYTYAAVKVWADTVNKIADASTQKVAAELKKTTYKTALGPIGFDAKGDVTGLDYVVYEWKKGNYAYAK